MSLQCTPVTASNSFQGAALDPHRPLYIELVKSEDYPKIEQIANEWSRIARKKSDETEKGLEGSKLQDCGMITSNAAFVIAIMSENPKFAEEKRIMVCKDTNGDIHGLAIVPTKPSNDPIHAFLATHPRNIRCKTNLLEPHRVEGVGRTFLNFFEKEISKSGLNSLSFAPTKTAVPFYKKFGFSLQKDKMTKSFPTPVSSKL